MAEKCTNTSSPFSRCMKPKPFAALNHFTVPFSFTIASFLDFRANIARCVSKDLRWPFRSPFNPSTLQLVIVQLISARGRLHQRTHRQDAVTLKSRTGLAFEGSIIG